MHFIDVFSPIIVIVILRNIIFFVLMKKQNFKCVSQYFTFLMSKSFKMNHSMKLQAMQQAFMIDFLRNFIFRQHEASAEEMCQIVFISHNSAQFEKSIFV